MGVVETKVVLLCGGKGTRLREETEYRPKPMVQIGGRPILWHIMKIYSHYGFKDFIVCLGYKGDMIKEYFLNYDAMMSDFTIELGRRNHLEIHERSMNGERNWRITLVNTGEDTQTGARVKKVEKYIDGDMFLLTYGDGVGCVNINKLVRFHRAHGKIGTMTGVHPSSRFGELMIRDNRVLQFSEKPKAMNGLVNGGFFAFNTAFFDHLKDEESCYLEREPLEALVAKGELMVYPHNGFWQCMDTYREYEILNSLWNSPSPPWKVW